VGQQVQFQMPNTMEEAVKLAVTVENVEKHKQMVRGSRKVFANKKEIECYRCNQSGHYCQQKKSSRNRRKIQGQSYNCGGPNSHDGKVNEERLYTNLVGILCKIQQRNADIYALLARNDFTVNNSGQIRRDCPKPSQKTQYPNGQGSMYRPPTSSQQQKGRN